MAIKRFKHNGLKRFFVRGKKGRIARALAEKLEDRLHNLDQAKSAADMALPGYHLHQLAGDRRGQWSVRVSGNWRIVFKFQGGEAVDVDLVDYH